MKQTEAVDYKPHKKAQGHQKENGNYSISIGSEFLCEINFTMGFFRKTSKTQRTAKFK